MMIYEASQTSSIKLISTDSSSFRTVSRKENGQAPFICFGNQNLEVVRGSKYNK